MDHGVELSASVSQESVEVKEFVVQANLVPSYPRSKCPFISVERAGDLFTVSSYGG